MMKIMSVLTVLALLAGVTIAQAQTQPMGPSQAQGQPTPSPKPPAQRPPQPQMGGQGMMGPGMMEHHRMMEMMCPMMMGMMMGRMMGQTGMARGMTGPGMMGEGMTGMSAMGNPSDPKAMARMLRLRGDMMKAMSEVLLKHAQELEQEK
ncbi:MAG TPA: hypothetical protein VFO18_08795 [Methylomirabilota bacterium]|nr:hypothetical protein [Methylomirabilota bacterium]